MLVFCPRVAFSLSLQACVRVHRCVCVCAPQRGGREPEKIPVTVSVNVFVLERMCERCQGEEKRDNYIIL